ncbi:7482_t:CDS:2 [Diversispora eburnea]|uniref:7482_t:CDS:1 n=1 Tax=Diversispora eburnea TaxID=1213867 RepID=A0A9N8WIQ5_9GLOM|nr:7482_t:CDS:2 [Diversispora eburnea]
MYQTAAPQYQTQTPFAVYGNTHITYTSNPQHSRNSSNSSISRHSPDTSFALEPTGYTTQLSYRFDPSVNTTANTMTGQQDITKSSPVSSVSSTSSSVTLSPENSSNILPPLSEVFSTSSAHNNNGQQQSSGSPTQSQVVPQQQVQSQPSSSNNFFQYSDVNAAAAASFAAAQQAAAQQAVAEGANFSNSSIVSQGQQQMSSNIPVVDPRSLPRIGSNVSEMQALSNAANSMSIDPNRNRNTSSMLAINTAGLNVSANETPMSAGSSTGSPIGTLPYHHPAANAHHQALLNSHFMAAAQSMSNGGAGLIAPTQRGSVNNRRNVRTDDGNEVNNHNNGERPQKVYSFVALPGINTKKRPRRRYDEIERHYACNFVGCTKSYGTLNHLNAHVQMQKHGLKRHPSGKIQRTSKTMETTKTRRGRTKSS